MKKSVVAIVISLVAVSAIAAYTMTAVRVEPPAVTVAGPSDYFDSSAATEERIRALEAAVSEERNARQLLEEDLQLLYFEIEQLTDQGGAIGAPAAAGFAMDSAVTVVGQGRTRFADTPEGRVERLVANGFSPDRAEWITQRESELRWESMQAQFEARRTGDFDRSDPRFNPDGSLRTEIGDTEYEQYLAATGRSTSVAIGSVIESSPGQRAGLLAGDEILRYDGTRIFSTRELVEHTMQGEPGQSIVVDIVRDGVPMQFVLPRGPIGVSTFRGRRGR